VRLQFLQLLKARAKQLYFYNYGYCHPKTGVWRYVGEGHTKGRYDRKSHHLEYAKRLDWPAEAYPNPQLIYWIRKLKREGLEPKIVILKGGMSQKDAYINERSLISLFGRVEDGGTLYNLDSGGLGGKQLSKKTRYKLSISLTGKVGGMLGKHLSIEARYKQSMRRRGRSSGMLNRRHTEETRLKMSLAHKGKTPWNKGKFVGRQSTEACQKKSEALKGRSTWNKGKVGVFHHSEESRRKNSDAHLGKPSSRKGKPGKPRSEEARRKQSETMKAIWSRKQLALLGD
jgi:hypothetical protein